MATPDDDPRALRAALRREGALAAFFKAGRAETRTPPAALLDAILAEAADAATDARPARAARTAAGARRSPPRAWPDFGAIMRPLGGWGGGAGGMPRGRLSRRIARRGRRSRRGGDLARLPLARSCGRRRRRLLDLDATEG